jgi:hypothetical protein
MTTKYKVGETVEYRGETGRIVEAHENDQGYGVLRRELKNRCRPHEWVSNLCTGGKGEPGDGGDIYRLEPVRH